MPPSPLRTAIIAGLSLLVAAALSALPESLLAEGGGAPAATLRSLGPFGAASAAAGVLAIGWMLGSIRSRTFFTAILFATFSLTGTRLGGIEPLAFALRYAFILVLCADGIAALADEGAGGWSWVQLALAGLLPIGIVSAWIAPESLAAATQLQTAVFAFLGIGLACWRSMRALSDVVEVVRGIAWAGIAIAGVNAAGTLYPGAFDGARLRSIYHLATSFANNIVLFVPFLAWASWLDEGDARLRRFARLGLAVLFILVLLSGTRNAMLSAAIATLIVLAFRRRALAIGFAGAMGFALVSIHALPAVIPAASALVERVDKSDTAGRTDLWVKAFRLACERPLLGYGLGRSEALMTERALSWKRYNAHNGYLTAWIEQGILGLLWMVGYFAAVWIESARALRDRSLSDTARSIAAPILAGSLALAFSSFFEAFSPGGRPSIWHLVWFLSGVLAARTIRLARIVGSRA